ncbi:uncharacterized protein LOC135103832 [Scylla paramamosain]|uniref:uncharacterized protein LOC135103832 n=1 Tax=Scylla paramamosain TaxID=85552 RepID=UPI003082ABB1
MDPRSFLLLVLAIVPASSTQTCTNQNACLVSCEGCTGITMVHDPINCHRFYYCKDDQLLTDSPFECPNGQEFNPQTHMCQPDLDGEGCRPLCASEPGECHYTCQPGDTLIASVYDCGTYYICDAEGNFGLPKTCPPEKPFFDGKKCQTDEILCCHCHGYCFPGDEGRLVADPTDCRRYYVCLNEGVPVYSGTCDKGEHFDAISRQCSTEAPCRTMCRNVIGANGCIENFTCLEKGRFAKCPSVCFPEYYDCLEFGDTYAPAVACPYNNYLFDPEKLSCVNEDYCNKN